MSRQKILIRKCIMVLGTGKSAVCLDNNSGGTSEPAPAGPVHSSVLDRDSVSSGPCVYYSPLTGDCIAAMVRCWYARGHGLCLNPSANPPVRFRVVS